jgi:primosomal replication protein N''
MYAEAVSDGKFDSARALLERMQADRPVAGDRLPVEADGFASSVEAFLRRQGWNPAPAHDGGAFGLDFAIEDPRSGLYRIGIECDAPRHRILDNARAREMWRPRVLRQAIPHIHRVSSREWMRAGDTERARLQRAVELAFKA